MADTDATVRVLVDAPRHAGLTPSLTYGSQRPLDPGLLVRVPFGRREVAGLTWSTAASNDAPGELREIAEVCDALPSLGAEWCALVEFAASYYQRSAGSASQTSATSRSSPGASSSGAAAHVSPAT